MVDARARRALLALCGHRSPEAKGLSPDQWDAIGRLSGALQLGAYLHWRETQGEIDGVPDRLSEEWTRAYRANGVRILAQRRALIQAIAALGDEGIGAVALKGSALAWTIYPAPAARAMRDIDLLVLEDDAPRAYETLLAAGWNGPRLPREALTKFSKQEAHLPPLTSPEKIACELHSHVWLKPPLPGASMPRADDASLLGNARYHEGLGAAVPSREDMLTHLVVHAVCSHLLNVGPMALIDVDLLCAKRPIDWTAFWERARRDQFDRPAALLFALIDRWRRPGFSEQAASPHTIAAELLDEAELLLVQPPETRKDVSAIASLRGGRPGGRLRQHPLDRAEHGVDAVTRTVEIGKRAGSLVRSLFERRTRRDGLATARLQSWIEG